MFAILKVILNALFFKFDVDKAVVEPRIHNQLVPNTTVLEPDFEKVSIKKTKPQFMLLMVKDCIVQGEAVNYGILLLQQHYIIVYLSSIKSL